jgi:hypothetical protein
MRYCFTVARVHLAGGNRTPEPGSLAWAIASFSCGTTTTSFVRSVFV